MSPRLREADSTDPSGTAGPLGAFRPARHWSAWHAVLGFGIVSLTADMVYEGARSVTGPLLASLGASAALVGLVTGVGEALALVLRLLFGSWADRRRNYWSLTVAGYAATALCVPALAVTPFVAVGGLALACVLILAERTGKAVRSPAKTALLAHSAGRVGLGRGFAVHKALDQTGAFAGPLLVAGVAAATGALWPAFAVLAVPGAAAMIILYWLRRRTGGPATPEDPAPAPPAQQARKAGVGTLPTTFWLFAAAAGAISAGLVTFGVISYHLTSDQVLPVPQIAVLYAAAMAAAALAALATGWLFDKVHARVLLVVPVLVAAIPVLAFSDAALVAAAGVLLWGAATGVQDSTIKAVVADLVPAPRRATAYGMFAAIQGGAAAAGGVTAGALYQHSLPALVVTVAATQLAALVLLIITLRRAGNRR